MSRYPIPGPRHRLHEQPQPQPDPDGPFIRPFMVTAGRTRPNTSLRVDALICTLPAARYARLAFEGKQIVELCARPISLAEVAAIMMIPLGVARVLIADLIAEGLLTQARAPELDLGTLERIRDLVDAL